jgi:hypothetical protein
LEEETRLERAANMTGADVALAAVEDAAARRACRVAEHNVVAEEAGAAPAEAVRQDAGRALGASPAVAQDTPAAARFGEGLGGGDGGALHADGTDGVEPVGYVRPVSVTPPEETDEGAWTRTMLEAGPGGPEHAARVAGTVYHYPLPHASDGESALFRTYGSSGPLPRRWIALDPLRTARGRHSCAVVDGRVYAIGGVGPRGHTIASVESFDPDTMTWSEVAPLPAPRRDFGCVVVQGLIIVAGGTAAPLHPDLVAGDEGASEDVCGKGGVGLGRGLDASPPPTFDSAVRSVFAYDPEADEWRSLPSMLRARQGLACASLGDVIFAIGGSSSSDFAPEASRLQSVEYFRLGMKEWGTAGSMAAGRSHFACGTLQGLAASDLNAATVEDLV